MIAELVGGERDVFTAACADQLSGLHGPKGKPCPARPWVCLLCPLAVFAPRHAANLLRLKAFFSRQWQQMPAAHFMAVFGPYAQRIDQVLDRYDPAVLAAAAAPRSADSDDETPPAPRGAAPHDDAVAYPDNDPAPGRSPFAGADVCRRSGAHAPAGNPRRPRFEDDALGLHRRDRPTRPIALCTSRFGFTAIVSPRWRLVAKELIFAMLAPGIGPWPRCHAPTGQPVHLRTARDGWTS